MTDTSIKSQGSKYDPNLRDGAEIARRIRADIKAAAKAGDLPAGIKVSIRTRRFSGGQSIDAHIVSGYGDFPLQRPVDPNNPDDWRYLDYRMDVRPNEPAVELADKVKGYLNAYNQDRSDSQVDYFDVVYYSTVYYTETGGLCWG